jgi:hypothetical protein
MKEVFACLYKSQPSLMAATQAFAAKRREIGSISLPRYVRSSHQVTIVSLLSISTLYVEPFGTIKVHALRLSLPRPMLMMVIESTEISWLVIELAASFTKDM